MQVRKDTLIRQKEIILAARKLIVTHGSEHVTVRKIAHEIGVTEAAIYKHFKSKRDVLALLIDDIQITLLADIDNNYDGHFASLDVLDHIVARHVSAIEQRRGVGFQVIAEIISLGDKKLNTKINEAITQYIKRIEEVLADGVKAGFIRPDIDLEAAARMFFSINQGLSNIWSLRQYNFSLREEYKPVWAIFLRAIANTTVAST
jgi:AcrR family transcriptional regulator